ncbi:hypothetical protein GCM10008023_05940 [Sphingomonas glacialis]|uniref:HK97 gp10 family phage protein n=1 Tax=Sphingomonas glacialis TaxID=658225 RepID=A0ABQ3L9X2_9SPHN|nr:hypothetical protein [Sphingomonas glacialis]GHH09356.1 hypothetical protein GCM10008023_05940 [Sphingomonas glacialis]
MIKAYLVNGDQVVASVERTGERIKGELKGGIGRLAIKLQNLVKTDKLRGQVLGQRSGRLSGSILQGVTEEGDQVVGKVSTNLNYGIGWELGWPGGGPGKPSLKDAKAKFSLAGSDMFANSTPKQRSFLRSALKDLEASGVIKTEIDAAIVRALK